MVNPLLEVRELQYSSEELIDLDLTTQRKEIIHQLSFKIKPHEFIGLVGPNGSGKTTLSKLLTQIIKPTHGTILLNGIPYSEFKPSWRLHQEISLVFQQVSDQFIASNFIADLSLSLRNFGWSAAKIEQCLADLTQQLHLEKLIKRPFFELSGGQQQLLAIAEALAVKPQLLILDEPTAQLDPENTLLVDQLLAKLAQQEALAILLISHKPTELALCQRILTLKQGQLAGSYATNELLLNPQLLAENQLPIPATLAIANQVTALTSRKLPLRNSTLAAFVQTIQDALC